jgi:hypothetical protein
MNLFRTKRVNVLSLSKSGYLGSREHEYSYGLDAVIEDADANITKVIDGTSDAIDEKVLCSLTSPLDIYRLLDTVKEKPINCELIVGGQGAFPVYPILDVSNKVALGRCEGRSSGNRPSIQLTAR